MSRSSSGAPPELVPALRVSDRHRTAFVTGASTGLGRAFTEMLLREGVRVWGTSRDVTRLADLAQPNASGFTAVALDLRDGAAAERVFRTADAAAGGFDLVVNNAGFGLLAEFVQIEFDAWRAQLDVMLIEPARLSHTALQGMLARNRGALVNISSLAAEFPLPFQSAYNMAKSGLSALNESLMVETAGTGVVVIDFRPGDYRTDFDRSLHRPQVSPGPRLQRAWVAFEGMMRSGPPPEHCAAALRAALLRHRSGTVRTGRFFQAVLAPFLVRFGSLDLKRRIQARYFDV
jgi:short-subunit dehydrogenase